MAKEEAILTSRQSQFLDFFAEEEKLIQEFYLTGGTALSAFYLQHRFSEDLDFFNEKEEVNAVKVKNFIRKVRRKFDIREIEFREIFGVKTFFLHYDAGEVLKVDFNYYPFPRIEKGIRYKNIVVDSLYDIAVNKVHTIAARPRARDFIDIFFIVREKGYSLHKLLMDAKAKFDWHIDAVHLGSRFLLAKDVKDYPRMKKKVDHNEWKEFFLKEAKKLKKDIFKNP